MGGHSQITALRKETRRHETMIRPSCCSALLAICCLLVTVETKSIGAVEIKSLAPAGADSTGALADIPDSDPHIDEFRESGNKHAEMTKMKSMEVGVKQAHRQHQVQLKKVKALRKDAKKTSDMLETRDIEKTKARLVELQNRRVQQQIQKGSKAMQEETALAKGKETALAQGKARGNHKQLSVMKDQVKSLMFLKELNDQAHAAQEAQFDQVKGELKQEASGTGDN